MDKKGNKLVGKEQGESKINMSKHVVAATGR